MTRKTKSGVSNRSKFTGFAVLMMYGVLLGCGGGSSQTKVVHASVAGTPHPLVAQVTVVSGCTGEAMVQFGPDTSYGRNTSLYAITAMQPLAIQVAGMRASSTYHMQAQTQCSSGIAASPDLTFTTGALPTTTPVPALQVSRPASPASQPESPGIEMLTLSAPGSNLMQAFFTDRDANPIWYYALDATYFPFTIKLLSNGHLLISMTSFAVSPGSLIREVDLAGNTIRQMTIDELQSKAAAAGYDFVPAGFHHDFLPLPNGHLIVLLDSFRNDIPDYPGVTVQGDALIDLDENWNPVWAWNSFDHLDLTRHLVAAQNGALDWTHANALVYSSSDGNLLLSMRHQSWVIKIDYKNGAGAGDVLWRLGYGGDFSLSQTGAVSNDPSLWFSFQHFPSIISQNGSETTMAIWDNGDNRVLDTQGNVCLFPGPPYCYSRAVVMHVDEAAMIANLDWVYAPNLYSIWGGSVNQLANGNIEYDANDPASLASSNIASEVQEVTQTPIPELVWKMDIQSPTYAYRTYRVPSLYPNVTWQY